MTELPIQPKFGQLTRISDPVGGRIYHVCLCGRFGRTLVGSWKDGSRRPQSCKQCARARIRREQPFPTKAEVLPFTSNFECRRRS